MKEKTSVTMHAARRPSNRKFAIMIPIAKIDEVSVRSGDSKLEGTHHKYCIHQKKEGISKHKKGMHKKGGMHEIPVQVATSRPAQRRTLQITS